MMRPELAAGSCRTAIPRLEPTQRRRAVRRAAICLILAALVEPVAERIAAAVWVQPPYSFVRDPVSDLGNPVPHDVVFGASTNSPWYFVANAGFLICGTLVLLATRTLFTLFTGAPRTAVLVLFSLWGTGWLTIAVFSQQSVNSAELLVHEFGAAQLVIGATGLVVVGIAGRRAGAALWYRTLSGVVGVVGVAAFVLLVTVPFFGHTFGAGTMERILVLGVFGWQIVTGIALLLRVPRGA